MTSPATDRQCPIDYALEVFGDRWSLIILRDLLLVGKRHYRELLASREGIATNVLAARIKKLEAHGLVTRRRSERDGRERIYVATDKAIALIPVLMELGHWSASHNPDTAFPLANFKRYDRDREAWIAELQATARAFRDAPHEEVAPEPEAQRPPPKSGTKRQRTRSPAKKRAPRQRRGRPDGRARPAMGRRDRRYINKEGP